MHLAVILDVDVVFVDIVQAIFLGVHDTHNPSIELATRGAHIQVDLVFIHLVDCRLVLHSLDCSLVFWIHKVGGHLDLILIFVCCVNPLALQVFKENLERLDVGGVVLIYHV